MPYLKVDCEVGVECLIEWKRVLKDDKLVYQLASCILFCKFVQHVFYALICNVEEFIVLLLI